jgi:hypothetical protein
VPDRGEDKCPIPSREGIGPPPPPSLFARARLAQLHSKTHATEQDACDGQGRAQDACLDAVAATKAEENPPTKGRQLTNGLAS